MNRILSTLAISTATLALGAGTAFAATSSHSDRLYPTQIDGHFQTGFTIHWSDGSIDHHAGWQALMGECKHDDHPAVCQATWRTYYLDLGTMRAILKSRG
jgi:hypothetical protein